MNHVIVDTDAFTHLWRPYPDSARLQASLTGTVPTLSFTTVAEVHFGAAKSGWGQRRMAQLEAAIRRFVIEPYDPELARLWGRLKAQAQTRGHALGHSTQTNDLWIATTAIYRNAPVLTLNRRHFEGLPGLSVLN